MRVITGWIPWLVLVGCGASTPAPESDSDGRPDRFVELAGAGCECETASCLNRAHQELEALLEEMGGFDEAPSAVHVSHREFDACWRAGTEDLGRDLEELAEGVCRCAENECWDGFETGVARMQDRYDVDARDPDDFQGDDRTVAERLAECATARELDAATYVAYLEGHQARVCACESLACYRRVNETFQEQLDGRLTVPDRETQADAIATAHEAVCRCFGVLAQRELGQAMSGVLPVAINADVTIECEEPVAR